MRKPRRFCAGKNAKAGGNRFVVRAACHLRINWVSNGEVRCAVVSGWYKMQVQGTWGYTKLCCHRNSICWGKERGRIWRRLPVCFWRWPSEPSEPSEGSIRGSFTERQRPMCPESGSTLCYKEARQTASQGWSGPLLARITAPIVAIWARWGSTGGQLDGAFRVPRQRMLAAPSGSVPRQVHCE